MPDKEWDTLKSAVESETSANFLLISKRIQGNPHCVEAMLWRQDDPFVWGACSKLVGISAQSLAYTVRLFLVVGLGLSENYKAKWKGASECPCVTLCAKFRQQNGIHQHSAGPMCTGSIYSSRWGCICYIWRWKYRCTSAWSRCCRRDANCYNKYESARYSLCNETPPPQWKKVSPESLLSSDIENSYRMSLSFLGKLQFKIK